MFKDLLVFEKQRTGKEAFGFFLAYLLFSGLLVGIITSFFSTSVAPSGFAEGFEQGFEQHPINSNKEESCRANSSKFEQFEQFG